MTNALMIYGQFDEMQRAAIALYESGYFTDSKSKAQAIVKVMAGAELGIPPFAAMTGIHIIQGKPALGANVLATLIKNDPRYNYRVLVMDDDVCKIEFYENGEPCGVSEFTAQDAQKASVKNMQKFPRNMLFARAISNGAKWYCPGIFGGAPVYTPDELGADVDEDGNVVTVQHGNGRSQPEPDIDDGEYTEQSEPAASGTIADIRASLDELKTLTLGIVADRAAMTDHYDNAHHALNAMKEFDFPDGVNVAMGQKVSKKGALELFDWLMERKQQLFEDEA